MQDPTIVLSILSSKPNNYCFTDLYKLLYNKDLYALAYDAITIYSGIDPNKNIRMDYMNIDVLPMIELLKKEQFKFNNEVYYKLLQSAIRLILNKIFDLHDDSASCVIWDIQHKCTGTKWWFCFDIDYSKLTDKIIIDILKTKISDQRFINLIMKIVNYTPIHDVMLYQTFSETPLFSILNSAIIKLVTKHIYLKLSNFIDQHNIGIRRKDNPLYQHYKYKISNLEQKLKCNYDEVSVNDVVTLRKQRDKISSKNEFDISYKRMRMFSYMTKSIISIIGNKQDVIDLNDIIFQIGIPICNCKIHNASDNTCYMLGYQLISNVHGKYTKLGYRAIKGNISLSLPYKCIINYLNNNRLGVFVNGKFKVMHKTELIDDEPLEIFLSYMLKLKEFYNYYKICINVSKIDNVANVVKTSLVMTLAAKYKTTCTKIYERYTINHNFGLQYKIKGESKILSFKSSGYVFIPKPEQNAQFDVIKKNQFLSLSRTNLTDRLNAMKCCMCGSEENLHVHHIRGLSDIMHKDLKDRKKSERLRKTIIVCSKCHKKLHNR